MSLFRRFRAALVLAGMWALTWGVAAGALAWVIVLAKGPPELFTTTWVFAKLFATIGATLGALSGLVFALALTGNRSAHAVAALDRRRVALMGAVAGVALPLGAVAVAVIVNGSVAGWFIGSAVALVGGLVGAGSAVATLQLARLAPPEGREQFETSGPAIDASGPAGRLK